MPPRSAPSLLVLAALAVLPLACVAPRTAVIDIASPAAVRPVSGGADPELAARSPADPGCAWTSRIVFARSEALPLCFAIDGACFGRAPSPLQVEVTLTVPGGVPAETGARLDFVADGVHFHAWTPGDEPLLFPRDPVIFGGLAIPLGATILSLARVGAGSVDLAMSPEPGVKLGTAGLRARVRCSELDIENHWMSPESIRAAIGLPAQGTARGLAAGQVLSIAATVAGPEIAEIVVQDDDIPEVEILEQRAARARVLWWRNEHVVFGWIDTGILGSPPPDKGSLTTVSSVSSAGGKGAIEPLPRPGMRCPADIPLLAAVEGARQEVGTIEKGTAFDVVERQDSVTTVKLRTRSVQLESNAVWLVPTSALSPCAIQ